ncbi:Xylulose kinase [Andreprevotia sp. IGB-42]|uniref:xylulokinase n=1 Tax=Andreprevotia sp. IGB-42 TaxID=2497473 RepID=UPI00135CD090|nr:FGGY family carbohydrate kinase [Andreprevotia sp. IGB-42]KAF0813821.1 Xylulose kinase [Andreprevotia sp. IGB-42]
MFLGIDIGTGSAKVLLLSADGQTVAEAGGSYAVATPRPGWHETDPAHWWRVVRDAIRSLPADARAAVRSIGLSGQMHGVVLCDGKGVARHPAVLWLDQRASDALRAYPPGSAQRCGNALSPGMAGPILAWFAHGMPDVLAGSRWALQPKDWLRLKLTGEAASEASDASATLLADRNGHWDLDLISRLGLPERLFAPQRGSAEAAGELTGSIARELGLPAGIPVATGAGDTPAAAFGAGLHVPGAAQLTTGSGAQLIVMQTKPPAYSSNTNGFCAVQANGLPGWYAMAAMQNAGVALEWARSMLGLSWEAAYTRAFAPGVSSGRVVFLPYLAGERTPWMNPAAQAGWIGARSGDDAGTLMRAALQGVAFAIRAGLEALHATGIQPARLRLAGGGSVHPAWQQLLIDTLGVPMDAVACPNASARGAALLGGMAAGDIGMGDLARFAPALTALGDPGSSNEQHYARFIDLYRRLDGWFETGPA